MKSRRGVLYFFLFILSGILAFSCQNRPKGVLNRKKMEQVMYDVYIAEAVMEEDYQTFSTPEKKEAYINRVFKLHKTTQAKWDSSLLWYSDRIDIYLKMNDSVKVRLRNSRKKIDELVAQNQMKQIDPSELQPSYLPPVYTFSASEMERGFKFRLDFAEVSSKVTGDDFLFTFSAIGIPPRTPSSFTSLLTLVYSDTTLYRFQEIKENKTYEFIASKYIPGDTIVEVRGFVHLQNSTGIVPPVRLHHISFGEVPGFSPEADTLKVDKGTPEGERIISDSTRGLNVDSIAPRRPDPRGETLKIESTVPRTDNERGASRPMLRRPLNPAPEKPIEIESVKKEVQ